MTEPPRRWIFVATGVLKPEAGGVFSETVDPSGIAESLLGEFSLSKPAGGKWTLFALAFVAGMFASGLRFLPGDLRFGSTVRGGRVGDS